MKSREQTTDQKSFHQKAPAKN